MVSIEQPEDMRIKVYVSEGTLVIEAPAGEAVSVYNVYGQRVYGKDGLQVGSAATSVVRIPALSAGFYAVKVGEKCVRKVIVM